MSEAAHSVTAAGSDQQSPSNPLLDSVDSLQIALLSRSYVADRSLAVSLFLARQLGKPILLEGEAGTGKTEVAKVMADLLGARLIRLQCYEGLDLNSAVYEWNYPRQMLEIRLLEAQGTVEKESLRDIFGREFLIRRPLLQAIEHSDSVPPILLIDELDRADAEFEAFLLELLSDFQITIPEIGTIRAEQPPMVILTSNRTREVHDALKRRCIYHWIDYPTQEVERAIIALKVPGVSDQLAQQVSRFIHRMRGQDLYKQPGVAESLDWTRALVALGHDSLSQAAVEDTLGFVLKYEEDLHRVQGDLLKTLLVDVVG